MIKCCNCGKNPKFKINSKFYCINCYKIFKKNIEAIEKVIDNYLK